MRYEISSVYKEFKLYTNKKDLNIWDHIYRQEDVYHITILHHLI